MKKKITRKCRSCDGTMCSAGRRRGKKRLRCNDCGKSCDESNLFKHYIQEEPLPDEQIPPDSFKKAKKYVITYAQNASPVNETFLASLVNYCKHNKAKLIVVAGKHRFTASRRWWDDRLTPHLFYGEQKICENLIIRGDLGISPIVRNPLSAPELISVEESAIVGHPKLRFKAMPKEDRNSVRIVASTGAITEPYYENTVTGRKSKTLHKYAAVVVEIAKGGKQFHVRQLSSADDGSFIDIDLHYSCNKVTKAPRAKALICGDIHVDKSDEEVLSATLTGPKSIAAVLRPEKVIYHDVLDFEVRNHHSINDPFIRATKASGLGPDSVEEEVTRAVRFLEKNTPSDSEGVVVKSNHDEAFDRWLKTADPKKDPKNARFFHEMCYKTLAYIEDKNEYVSAFDLFYRDRGNGSVKFLKRNEKLEISGIICNFHGDKGVNGSRGSISSFEKIGRPMVIGHSHSPGIQGNVYQVGVTGSLDMGYNYLPSSWMNTHCVIYANGERSLINVIQGKWRK